jgi:prolyl oligopeptidase
MLRTALLIALLLPMLASMPAAAQAPVPAPAQAPSDDPHLWLEDVTGDQALDWVRARNATAEKEFAAAARYEPLRKQLLSILDSRDRIPFVTRMGEHYYNFWRDAANPRGLWRRTTLAEYAKAQPAWDVVIDLDALAKSENENWVWQGADCLRPEKSGQPYRRCIIGLSRGGADASVQREFDLIDRAFVKGGFTLPEAKQDMSWKDIDTVWVGTDFGPGSMTTSGYPRIVKEWKRGTPLSAARTVYEGQAGDVAVGAYSERESGQRRDWVRRGYAFFDAEHFVQRDGKLVKLDIPSDATPGAFKNFLLVTTRKPWTVDGRTFAGGTLLAIDFERFLAGERRFDVLFEPTARHVIETTTTTRDAVLISSLDNVNPRLTVLRRRDGQWIRTAVDFPAGTNTDVVGSYWDSNEFFTSVQGFTTPTTLQRRDAERPADVRTLKSLPSFFDATGITVVQHEAVSKDGTRIPYFVVMRSGLKLDGTNPTLIYGYGGYQVSILPWYSGSFGKGWLEPGGVLVVANLRGGGEFGPAWHLAAQKENKQRTWDDMAAVAEDVIKRGISSPPHLGIMGGSQGGLLVTATLVQRPELFRAVVSQVPLVDMLRFHKLLAGASWIAEYGDPDKPDERAWIEKYSPYQNVKKGVRYPRIFLYTSTRDDRVHPGHARKMVARMSEQGHDVLYFENIEGGHGAAANNEQAARMWAQTFTFLWRELGNKQQ